jgi:DNA (cytosine-5)-methyltransferase 1
MVGNSVSPWPMMALIEANMTENISDMMEAA